MHGAVYSKGEHHSMGTSHNVRVNICPACDPVLLLFQSSSQHEPKENEAILQLCWLAKNRTIMAVWLFSDSWLHHCSTVYDPHRTKGFSAATVMLPSTDLRRSERRITLSAFTGKKRKKKKKITLHLFSKGTPCFKLQWALQETNDWELMWQ